MEIFDSKSQNDIFDQKCPKSIEFHFDQQLTRNYDQKLTRNYEICDFSSKLIISSFEKLKYKFC